jgi:uncharacterized protein YmfQ (DUF2313 family)
MDEIPTVAGTFEGTVYLDGEGFYAPDTDADVDVEFFAYLDGVISGTLTTVSDATVEIIIDLLGETLIDNNHGRSITRRLPTGMAWMGDSQKAFMKGLALNMRRTEIDFNDKAQLDNILFGDNLASWQTMLGLLATGNIADQEKAVIRKLTDVGGLQAADLTRELHTAGFTDLYAYANKFSVTCPALTFSDDTTSGDYTTASEYKSFVSINPLVFRFMMPYLTFSDDTTSSDDTTGGESDSGADLVVNSSDDESSFWIYIQSDFKKWIGCFFICGDEFGKIVDLDTDRQKELRKLICEIKPFKSYGIMLINYI